MSTNIQPDTHQPGNPFPEVPAPWLDMKAEIFFCLARASASKGLPPSSYGPVETGTAFADQNETGKFAGRVAMCMIVRYSQTPVGPYDEVLWAPGYFEVPATGKKRERITRIYVSRLESVYNGRRNWNIPKELASFKFHPSDSKYPPYKRIEVSLPETPDGPFIDLDLQPIPLLSRPIMPISTSYIPMKLDITIPPVPQSDNWQVDGRAGSPDGKWKTSQCPISGWAGLMKVKGKLGNGSEFPELKMGSLWFWVKDAKMAFLTVDDDKKTN